VLSLRTASFLSASHSLWPEHTVPAGQHAVIGSINGNFFYDSAIVYETRMTDPDTGKKLRFVAPFSIAVLDQAQGSWLVKIAEPHRAKVAEAIAQGRGEQEVAQEREVRLRRRRDEIIPIAPEPPKRSEGRSRGALIDRAHAAISQSSRVSY
jgi:hypothetical protein